MKSNRKPPSRRLEILLVENDPSVVAVTKIAFQRAGLEDSVTAVSNGDEALAFLKKADKPNPDLIFLDLHLPKKSGLEVLEEIKTNPAWAVTPVVIVSGDPDPREVRKAYELHASCFVQKPNDLGEFLEFAKICFEFWGKLVTLPESKATGGS